MKSRRYKLPLIALSLSLALPAFSQSWFTPEVEKRAEDILKNMTVKECYEQMGADYEGVLGRLRSEVLIKKFAKKFLDDGSFRSLKDNLVQKNGEEAFRAAHTLKGVCQNLGFDNLYKASFDITEKLRGRDTEGCEELLAKVEEQYNNTVDAKTDEGSDF